MSARLRVELAYDQRADSAVAEVLSGLLDLVELNLPGAGRGEDPELLHDLRVSIRRTRAVQRQFRSLFPRSELDRFRRDFRHLQQVTGAARDLDVLLLSLPGTDGALAPLLDSLRVRSAAAHLKLGSELRSRPVAEMLDEWRRYLEDAVPARSDARAGATPIGELAGRRIGRLYAQLVQGGRKVEPSSPPAEYHELRKTAKELRYLIELFGAPLYPRGVVRPLVGSLKALQDVLGRQHDRVVQIGTLRAARATLAQLSQADGSVAALEAALRTLAEDEQLARCQFAERFAALEAPSQRRRVRSAFR
jgi:CHAD domain-containing protein